MQLVGHQRPAAALETLPSGGLGGTRPLKPIQQPPGGALLDTQRGGHRPGGDDGSSWAASISCRRSRVALDKPTRWLSSDSDGRRVVRAAVPDNVRSMSLRSETTAACLPSRPDRLSARRANASASAADPPTPKPIRTVPYTAPRVATRGAR